MADETNHTPVSEWRDNIDRDVRNMGERLAGVEAGIFSLGRNFDKFSNAFEQSNNRQAELQKTRWPLVFGVLSLVMVIAGAFLSGYLRDLNRIEADVLAIQGKRVSQNDAPQDARIAHLGERMKSIENSESVLENKLLNHVGDGHPRRVEEQVFSIRREMEQLHTEVSGLLESNPRQDQVLEDLNEEMLNTKREEHADMTRDASAIERIRSLERHIFSKPGGGIYDAETHHGEEP